MQITRNSTTATAALYAPPRLIDPLSILGRLEGASRRTARYRWFALAITTFCQAATISLAHGIGPLAPLIQADYGASRAEIGLILGIGTVIGVATALAGGWAADRIGERRVLIISGLVAGVAGVAISRAEAFWAFLLVYLVIGLGSGVQNPAGSAAVMRWFPPRLRGLAMGIRQTGIPLGGILAASAWPAIGLAAGWRTAYVVAGLLTLLGALLILLAYFDPVRDGGRGPTGPRRIGAMLADRRILWLGLVFNSQIFAQLAATTYLVLFLHEAHGVPVVGAAALLAGVNGVAIVARIGWGLLSDRTFAGQRRPVLLAILALTLAAVLYAAALPGNAPWPFALVLAMLLGVSAFAWTGVLGTLVIETAGRESPASAIALVTAVGAPGSLLGPPLFGLIVDQTGSYRIAWLAVALVVALGLLAIRQVAERPHLHREAPDEPQPPETAPRLSMVERGESGR
jgi:predicted MFS family arabinose efflux permease